MTQVAVPVTAPEFTLAEGPVWDAPRGRVLWVDIEEGLVLEARLDLGPQGPALRLQRRHRFESYVGCVAVAADGSLLVAQTRRLTHLALDGTRTSTNDLLRGRADHRGPDDRFNDGVCDAAGRLLIGTLSLPKDHRDQRLMSINGESVTVLDDDLGLSNGLAFSPDGTLLYSVDSVPGRRIWVRGYDQTGVTGVTGVTGATGTTGPRRLLFAIDDGIPDGLCVDADGNLWVAIWGRGQVRRYDPAGTLLDTIDVPAPHTTCLAFVGPELDLLLITTARSELTDEQLAEFPLSGSLFLTRPGVVGLPSHPWSGVLNPAIPASPAIPAPGETP